MSTPGTRHNPADRRRSRRVLLPIAVRISVEPPNGRQVEEETSTLVVNAMARSCSCANRFTKDSSLRSRT